MQRTFKDAHKALTTTPKTYMQYGGVQKPDLGKYIGHFPTSIIGNTCIRTIPYKPIVGYFAYHLMNIYYNKAHDKNIVLTFPY